MDSASPRIFRLLPWQALLTLTLWALGLHGWWLAAYTSPGTDEARHLLAGMDIGDTLRQEGMIPGLHLSWRQSYEYPPLFRLAGGIAYALFPSIKALYASQYLWELAPITLLFLLWGRKMSWGAAATGALFLFAPGIQKYLREFWPDGSFFSAVFCALIFLAKGLETGFSARILQGGFLALCAALLTRQTGMLFTTLMLLWLGMAFLFRKRWGISFDTKLPSKISHTEAQGHREYKKIFDVNFFLMATWYERSWKGLFGFVVGSAAVVSWYAWSLPQQWGVLAYHFRAGSGPLMWGEAFAEFVRQTLQDTLGFAVVLSVVIVFFLEEKSSSRILGPLSASSSFCSQASCCAACRCTNTGTSCLPLQGSFW